MAKQSKRQKALSAVDRERFYGVDEAISLVKSGFTNLEGLRDAAVEDLVEILSVDEAKAKEIHEAIHQETPAAQ